MKYPLLLLLLMATLTTAARAQCGCPELRLAVDDHHAYQYRYYLLGHSDTTTVQLLSPTDQVHHGGPGISVHQAYGVYDPTTGQTIEKSYDDRLYLVVSLSRLRQPQPARVQVEVREPAAQQTMTLTFGFVGIDGEGLDLLFDFVPGSNFELDLTESNGGRAARAGSGGAYPFELTPVAGTGMIPWLKLRRL